MKYKILWHVSENMFKDSIFSDKKVAILIICICHIDISFLTFSYVSALHVVLSKIHFYYVSGNFALCSLSPLVFRKIAFWLSSFRWSPNWSVFYSLAVELVRGFFVFIQIAWELFPFHRKGKRTFSCRRLTPPLLHLFFWHHCCTSWLCVQVCWSLNLGLKEGELDDGTDCWRDRLLQMFTHS